MLQTVVSGEAAHRIRQGRAYAFRDEILSVDGTPELGEPVRLVAEDGTLLGVGDVDLDAPVAVRRLGLPSEQPEGLVPRQLRRAIERRTGLVDDPRYCRLVNDEGDGLPGLIVDRYDGHYALQTFSRAMDARVEEVARALVEVAAARSVILRNDSWRRPAAGLPVARRHVVYGTPPRWTRIQELGARLTVDLHGGAETGHRYELREVRRALGHLARGARVLELTCQVGSKVIQAGLAGARQVVAYDADPDAVELTRENIALHGLLGRAHVEHAAPLEALEQVHTTFDLVLVDVPAGSGEAQAFQLLRGALHAARRGGILLASMTHAAGRTSQLDGWLAQAAEAESRAGFELFRPGTPADFPSLLGAPEVLATRVVELD